MKLQNDISLWGSANISDNVGATPIWATFVLIKDNQYTSAVFEEYIKSTKIITHSFSGKGCPYDSACIESFHASLKKEEVNLVHYFDYTTARLAIF